MSNKINKNTMFSLKYPVIYYERKNFRLQDLPPHLREYVEGFMKNEEELTKKEREIIFNRYELSDILDYFKIYNYKIDGDMELTQF
jgi:hypothetical protein